MKRVFAIGLKKHVEVRAATEPPKREASSFTKTVPVLDGWDYWTQTRLYRDKRIRFNVVIYNGGKVLCTIRRKDWDANLHLKVPKGKLVEIPGEWAESFLDRKWRKRNLRRV